jgi:membrane associated rhomboid family serine protease
VNKVLHPSEPDEDKDAAAVPQRPARTPILNAPPIVTLLLAGLVGAFFVVALLPIEARRLALFYWSVAPPRLTGGHAGPGDYLSLVTHMAVHGGPVHLALNSLWLLAFGAPVARRMGAGGEASAARSRAALAFAALFVASGVAGALAFVAMHPREVTFLMGASGGIHGLLGALVRFGFRPAAVWEPHRLAGLLSAPVLTLSTIIIGLNVFAGFFGSSLGVGEVKIAWESHIGGYVFGLLAFPFFLKLASRTP